MAMDRDTLKMNLYMNYGIIWNHEHSEAYRRLTGQGVGHSLSSNDEKEEKVDKPQYGEWKKLDYNPLRFVEDNKKNDETAAGKKRKKEDDEDGKDFQRNLSRGIYIYVTFLLKTLVANIFW